MRSEQEIQSALHDLEATKHLMRKEDGSALLSAAARDTLKWVLGLPSVMGQSAPKLRSTLATKEKAAKN